MELQKVGHMQSKKGKRKVPPSSLTTMVDFHPRPATLYQPGRPRNQLLLTIYNELSA
jgi:hypothetical protein